MINRQFFKYGLIALCYVSTSQGEEASSYSQKEGEYTPEMTHDMGPDYHDSGVEFDDIYLNPNAVHVILEPINRATLSAQITSPVVAVNKQMGDSFRAGEVLVQLDDAIYRANLKRSVAVFRQAQLTLNTRRELYEANVGSKAELMEAEAEAARADAELTVARKQMEASSIVAPYSGRVVDVFIHDYELAEALEPLMEIIGDEILIARMIIESSQLNRISIGTQLQIAFPEVDVVVPAEIIRIGAEIDPASSTVRVDARIENSDLKLTAGLSGVTILPARPERTGVDDQPIIPMHQLPEPEEHLELPQEAIEQHVEPKEEEPETANLYQNLKILFEGDSYGLDQMRSDLEALGIFKEETQAIDIFEFIDELDDDEIAEINIEEEMKELGLIDLGERK